MAEHYSGGAQDSGKLADGLVNVTISNCVATVQGGAIYRDEMLSESTIKLNGCTITGCTAGNGSGSGNIFYIKAYSNNYVEYPCHLYVDGSLLKDVGKGSSPYVADKLTYGDKTAPDAVGDIVFSDGSASSYVSGLTLSDEEKAAAIAVIFYVGSSTDSLGEKTLGLGLVQGSDLCWCTETAAAYDVNTYATSETDGSENMTSIKTVNDYGEENYPAFYYADNYSSQAGNHVSGTNYEDEWYLPAKGELRIIYNNKTTVDAALSAAGGTNLPESSGFFWSSSQYVRDDDTMMYYAWKLIWADGTGGYQGEKENTYSVLVIREF